MIMITGNVCGRNLHAYIPGGSAGKKSEKYKELTDNRLFFAGDSLN
jgi:hypothetical protein